MPEGDTVAWTAARLHAALAGEQLVRAELRWPSLAQVDLVGGTTRAVVARGKHLLHRIELDGGRLTLHSHLRMDGTWRVRPAVEKLRWDHRLRALLGTREHVALGRSLGMLDLVRTADEDGLVGHLGPDILAPRWGEPAQEAPRPAREQHRNAHPDAPTGITSAPVRDLIVARVGTDPRPLAQALLDQRVVAGLGTFWVSEACFARGVPPWRPAGSLPPETVAALLDWARPRMLRSARTGVQSVTGLDRRDSLGAVHARSGRPCRRCGGTLRVALVGPATQERTIFYCPACQGGLAPTDDGRPQTPLGAARSSSTGGARRGNGGSGPARYRRG